MAGGPLGLFWRKKVIPTVQVLEDSPGAVLQVEWLFREGAGKKLLEGGGTEWAFKPWTETDRSKRRAIDHERGFARGP